MTDSIWPDLVICEKGHVTHPDEPPNPYPMVTNQEGQWVLRCGLCEASEPDLQLFWSHLGKHQAYALNQAMIAVARSIRAGSTGHRLLDLARSSAHDDRMMIASTTPDDSQESPAPDLVKVSKLSMAGRLHVVTDPDFQAFVDHMAEGVRAYLQEDEELENLRDALIVELFRPPDLTDVEELFELEEAVMRAALDELAPLLVRICATGDWRES